MRGEVGGGGVVGDLFINPPTVVMWGERLFEKTLLGALCYDACL